MPKVSIGITNVSKQVLHAENSYGTKYDVPFNHPDFKGWVCMPGAQFIDSTAWVQELLSAITNGVKRK